MILHITLAGPDFISLSIMFDDSMTFDITTGEFIVHDNDFDATLSPESVPEFDEKEIEPSISMFGDDFFSSNLTTNDFIDAKKNVQEQTSTKVLLKPKPIVTDAHSRIFYPFESYQSTEICVKFLREWTQEKYGIMDKSIDIFKVV